ncbi:MAG: amino acid permease [Acidimicrobiales bacterium]|nr:amino acid permease [Acidimicrobiales bacterium]
MKTEDDLQRAAAQGGERLTPKRMAPRVDLPETWSYRAKTRLLGAPLATDRLEHERLGKPTALAVFASDNLSSSAYATEEILRVLIPAIGVAAFALVVPVTVAMLIVLGFLILSYRQTIKAYPSAGGAYIVTKDNFGALPAQVAGVSLLTDYILTVAVSVSAGSAALASAVPALAPWVVPISIGFILIIAFGNLKGVRESGKVFAVPTYFFMFNMVLLLGVGLYQMAFGDLPVEAGGVEGMLTGTEGSAADGVFYGATLFVVLHAFASGGAAVTGVEAISNGVPAFKEPAAKNASSTLVVMGTALGFMFLGLSLLASKVHATPFEEGTPTVISQVGKLVYGTGALGEVLFYSLQVGTMLILVLAANTGFADFPRLASFAAGDSFMPRQLTKRGHRLVFSNGIIALAAAAIVLVIVTGAKVDRLIPLYAIGVFTSFTLSQAGMAKHHITHKEPHWQLGLFINGVGAAMTFVVAIIVAVTKFTHGAWVIIALIPILVVVLFRLNRQYTHEAVELLEDAHAAASAPILRRHVVLVLVDTLDVAAARAIQYARTLTPDELRAVHLDLDPLVTADLARDWRTLGLGRLSLDIVECQDRRVTQAAAEIAAQELADGETEVSVLIPRREYSRFWHRLLHDRTSDEMVKVLSTLPHCNVTVVPYHLDLKATPVEVRQVAPAVVGETADDDGAAVAEHAASVTPNTDGTVPIGAVEHRQRVMVSGRIRSIRVQPWSGVPALECTLADDSGGVAVVFLGRREVPGIRVGVRLKAQGVVGEHHGRLAILNPVYEILA